MTSQFSVLLKKYSVPAFLLLAGIIMLYVGFSNEQDGIFKVASILMLAAGAISLLYSSGKFKPMLVTIIGLAAGVAAFYTLYISYDSVSSTSEYNRNYKHAKLLAKQNLEDIRYIQKAYAEQNGVYLSSWEELIDFANNGTIPFVDAQGVVPARKVTIEENKYLYKNNPPIDNNMTEDEAYKLSQWKEGPNWAADFASFKRDTIQVSLLQNKFGSKSYKENRVKQGFDAFSAEALPIIPFTDSKWTLETLDSLTIADVTAPVIKVSGSIPFAEIQGKNDNKEEMFFGSLTTHNVDGSWEAE